MRNDFIRLLQGIRGQDLDTTFVLREKLQSNENETEFDRSLRSLKSDRSALTKHIAEILESQIKSSFADEIVRFKLIEANYSLISIHFTDETKVEIFLDVQTEEHSSIHGVRHRTFVSHSSTFFLDRLGSRYRTIVDLCTFTDDFSISFIIYSTMGTTNGSLRTSFRLSRRISVGDSLCKYLSRISFENFVDWNFEIWRILFVSSFVLFDLQSIHLVISNISSLSISSTTIASDRFDIGFSSRIDANSLSGAIGSQCRSSDDKINSRFNSSEFQRCLSNVEQQ